MAQPLASPYSYFADSNGVPLNAGKVYTYEAGSVSTPKDSYTDSSGSTAAANPVILDSAGRATIWLNGYYKIVVKDSLNNVIYTTDNITAIAASGDMEASTYDPAGVQEQVVGLTAFQSPTNKSFDATNNATTQAATDSSTKLATTAFVQTAIPSRQNIIINGGFYLNQEAPATNADDTYAHDGWYALTQTSTIAITTLTDVENTTPRMARLTQSQASAQRMGYATIIEGKDCKQHRGQQVSLKLRYRSSLAQPIRFAVLEWTGTEDSVTSDVVNDWTSGTYTAGNFFLASNLTITSVAAFTPNAATLTDYTVTATLGSSFNNLIVFVWTEGTIAQNATLDLGKVKLEPGPASTLFIPRSAANRIVLCQRFLPAWNGVNSYGMMQGISTTGGYLFMQFPVETRVLPTSIVISTVSGFSVTNATAGTTALSSLTYSTPTGTKGSFLLIGTASGLALNQAGLVHNTNASAQILFKGAQL